MAVWTGVIAALGGALIGGGLTLLNGRLQFKQPAHRDRQKLLLSKLEELYDFIGQVRRSYEASALERINSYLNIETAADGRSAIPTPIERVQLLVSCYAPELSVIMREGLAPHPPCARNAARYGSTRLSLLTLLPDIRVSSYMIIELGLIETG